MFCLSECANIAIKYSLQRLLTGQFEVLTERERCMVKVLIDLCSSPNPLCPKNVFGLNYSTGLSAIGLGLTYVIVLLQFRFGE